MENKKLEEAAEAFVSKIGGNNENARIQRVALWIAFMAGSRWQQEQNKELLQQRDEILQAFNLIMEICENHDWNDDRLELNLRIDGIKDTTQFVLSKINP